MKICSVTDCGRKLLARGLCGAHYRRLTIFGDARAEKSVRGFKDQNSRCTIEGCGKTEYTAGLCGKHYQRNRIHGDPLKLERQPNGSGTKNRLGYRLTYSYGKQKLEHLLIAEKALGRPLPDGVEVHHVDRNPSNNARSNLVICPDHAYHALLHSRQRALDECGNANLIRCRLCGKYDQPNALYITATNAHHRECKSIYQKSKRRIVCQMH